MAETFSLQEALGQDDQKRSFSLSEALGRSREYERGRQESNPLIRGLANVIQGPLMGFGDEALAGVSALIHAPFSKSSLPDLYRAKRDRLRGIQDQYKEDFPVGSAATQMAAAAPLIARNVGGEALRSAGTAIAPNLAARYGQWVAPAGEAAGVFPRAVQGALSGTVFGGIAGAGDSTAETLGGLAADTGKGAAFGGIVGGSTPLITSGINAVVNQIAPRFSDRRATDFAREKVAEALRRDVDGYVTEADPALRAAARMRMLGPEARVVDSGREATRQLLDTTATLPGATRTQVERAIRERQVGRPGRLVDAADDVLGTQGAQFRASVEAFDQARREAATPLYNQLRGLTVEVDDDLASLLSRSEGVHRDAEKLFRARTGTPIDLTQIKVGDRVPFDVLDSLKASLYDAGTSAKRAGNNRMGAAVDDIRVALTGKLVDVAPKDAQGNSIYRQALDAWAGPSQLIDAAEVGRRAMRDDAFSVADAIRNMTASEREAMRIGALQALREKTGTQAGQTSLLKLRVEPATQERLRTIFGGDYRQFAAAVAREEQLKALEQVGRGSQTASRQFAAGDLDLSPLNDAASVARSAASGNVLGTAQGIAQGVANAWNRVKTPEPVRDAIGRILLSRDPEEIRSLTGLLDDINRSRSDNALRAGQFSGLLY